MRRYRSPVGNLLILAVLLAAGGCAPRASEGPQEAPDREPAAGQAPSLSPVDLGTGEQLRVVATTSIVADVVQTIGGDLTEVVTLLPLGADPHAFDPTPRDAASVADAHVVFANGAGLEVFLDPLLESAGESVMVVAVSDGIELLAFGGVRADEPADEHNHRAGADPHVWFDPHSVMAWADRIADTLAALDPVNAETYEANARTYRGELEGLDAWIVEQVAQVAPQDRKLVTDHKSFSYFARRYGFDQIGAVFPGYSTLAEPSARELADLEEAIQEHGVKAVFVGFAASPDLAARVADDTGTRLVYLYTGSLSDRDGPASDYISFMKYNVNAIVAALQ